MTAPRPGDPFHLDLGATAITGHYPEAGDPEELGGQVAELVRRLPNLDILGGSCCTWDDHLSRIARRLHPEG